MRNRLTVAVLALTMVLASCSATGGDVGGQGDPPGSTTTGASGGGSGASAGAGTASGVGANALAVALQQFDQCDSLLTWIHSEAAERVGPYGFGQDHFVYLNSFRGATEGVDFAATDDAGAVEEAAAPGDGTYSGTNVQEAGVDEPDLVKTDGERLYLIADGTLHVVEANSNEPVVLDSVRFSKLTPQELLLGDGHLYVVASRWIGADAFPEVRTSLPLFAEEQMMVIVDYAIAADGTLVEEARLEVSGSYVTARQIDGVLRLVIRHDPSRNFPFVFPSNTAAEESAAAANKAIVANSELKDWLPFYVLTTADGDTTSGVVSECDRVTAPQEFSGMSTVTVLTIDQADALDAGAGMTLFGAADTVYASTDSLYTATYAYPEVIPFIEGDDFSDDSDPVDDPDPEFTSQIHRFDLTDPTGATYVASGEVQGTLLNQFSMSELDGHLRVASTEGSPWWGDRSSSSSSVTVLATEGDALVQTGIVEDLGIDESIFGVRFIGDRGYVVTFRQTDPLYVLDLSDPADPRLEGELKITGYSAYLHPVSEDLLLGVGQEADLNGRTEGTKVALFDVSDPADPVEVDKWVLEDSSTAVEWDHRAFLWWEPEALAVIPLDSWRGDRAGAVGLRVDGDDLVEIGTVILASAKESVVNPDCTIYDEDQIDENSELWWIVQEGGVLVGCPDDEIPASGSYACEPIDSWGISVDGLLTVADPDDNVEICWPDHDTGRQINRTVVIGETLWTIGNRAVQSNVLSTLETIATVWF